MKRRFTKEEQNAIFSALFDFSVTLGEIFQRERENAAKAVKMGKAGISQPEEKPKAQITRKKWTKEDDERLLSVADASLDALELLFPNRTRRALIERRSILIRKQREGRIF
jgi:hypothetical protein